MKFHIMWLFKKGGENFFKNCGENEKGKNLPEAKALKHFEDKQK